MFIYDFSLLTSINISVEKPSGTNDSDPRFSPNESEVIFVNTSNDGVSQKNIYNEKIGVTTTRTLLFEDAKMPDWK